MLQPNITASPATVGDVGSVRFGDRVHAFVFSSRWLAKSSKIRVGIRFDLRSVHYAQMQPATTPGAVADPEAYLAMGVLRITTALSSNSGREEVATTDRSNVVMFAGSGRPHDSASRAPLST